MAVKTTIAWGTATAGKPFGFSESHYYIPSDNLDSAQTAAVKLAGLRNALMGDGIQFFGIRLAVMDQPRVGRFVPSAILIGTGALNESGVIKTQFGKADQPNACLYCRGSNQDVRHTSVYLAGIPDSLLRTDPPGPDFNATPGWKAAFEEYRDLLVTGNDWGFKARALNPPKTNPINYVTDQDGSDFLGVVVTDDIANVGDRVQIRNTTLFNKANPKVNGMWRVSSKATNTEAGTFTYYLRNTQLLDPLNINEMGTIELVSYNTFSYTCFSIRGQTTRKRGVGSIRPRGRSRNRVA